MLIAAIDKIKPDIAIVDSIQDNEPFGYHFVAWQHHPGKGMYTALDLYGKNPGIFPSSSLATVNKDGAIAGPKVLEHMVDCVLYF